LQERVSRIDKRRDGFDVDVKRRLWRDTDQSSKGLSLIHI